MEKAKIPDERAHSKIILSTLKNDAQKEKLIKIVSHEIMCRSYALNDMSMPGLLELFESLKKSLPNDDLLKEIK
jgi:hypothetical protein